MEKHMQDLHAFNINYLHSANTFAVLLEHEGKLKIQNFIQRPCYGELRDYGKNSTRPQDYKPGDLTQPMAPGTPLKVAVPCQKYTNDPELQREFLDWVFTESPYRMLGKDIEYTEDKKGFIVGYVFDTDIDPTPLAQFLIHFRGGSVNQWNSFGMADAWKMLRDSYGCSKLTAFTIALIYNVQETEGSIRIAPYFTKGYTMKPRLNVKAWIDGRPKDLTGGTLLKRFSYNRPDMPELWAEGEGNVITFGPQKYASANGWVQGDQAKALVEDMERQLNVAA